MAGTEVKQGEPATAPLRIAHKAGNRRYQLERALRVGVDLIEADIWFQGRRLVARHERKVPLLPILFDKWFLKLDFGQPLTLEEIASQAKGKSNLFLDVKRDSHHIIPRIVEVLNGYELGESTSLSSDDWRVLLAAEKEAPQFERFHSIGDQTKLDTYWRWLEDGLASPAVSIRQTLLDTATVEALKNKGVKIFAWTVDEPARARQLVQMGVDGIISNNLELLNSLSNAASD